MKANTPIITIFAMSRNAVHPMFIPELIGLNITSLKRITAFIMVQLKRTPAIARAHAAMAIKNELNTAAIVRAQHMGLKVFARKPSHIKGFSAAAS